MQGIALWIAQGFGVGRLPIAPGTFGSVIGLLWFMLLLQTQNLWLYLLGTALGLILSVWLCGIGERILKKRDPGSVVLDEIAAMPVCFFAWVFKFWIADHTLPPLGAFFARNTWQIAAGVFVLFRIFDILKPWPIRASQGLAAGWGITIDDFLAATYVAIAGAVFVWLS